MSVTCGRVTCCLDDPFLYESCPTVTYYSAEVRLVCGPDSLTDPIIIPPGTFTSTVSQAAADAAAEQNAADQRFTTPCA